MDDRVAALVRRRYQESFGAHFVPSFETFLYRGSREWNGAALGYRRAGSAPLFLERYLSEPVEQAVSTAFGRPVERSAIVEIGNFAAENAMAMVALWGAAANDLGGQSEVAVATLTAPLRGMFSRIGVPLHQLGVARAERSGDDRLAWGSYYAHDPQVCAGPIGEGQAAIAAFLGRRRIGLAA